ncbi:MAG: hypothetical protein AN488_11140 [Anabaena sp. WA113]|jgi:hypothetical protein|uniref:TEK-like protein n=1 Tax=Aphanizomenon flos-aquae WA102 TaxID=1710896 RepID=A0A1B7X5W8_APHFL|nr:MAG: hypothetical protein AN488_11140 [Anabaena sp. WA113]OBQ44779.1 MAG: hypothetical protein AN484_05470 [Aphanizomenon flos-aquae WA102]
MKTTSNKVLKAAAIASLLAGSAIAGSFISTESAQAQTTVQAQDSQSRVSGALTSVLSNGVTNSFAAEIVYPQNDFTSDGTVTLSVTYATVVGTTAASGDISQVAITNAKMVGVATAYTSGKTVEAATARAIDAAASTSANRFGDINGIVKSWRGSNGLD